MLQLVPSPSPAPLSQLSLPARRAANGFNARPAGPPSRRVNTIVSQAAEQVAARVGSAVTFELDLARDEPTIQTDPSELSFVIGALLGASLCALGEEDGTLLAVSVRAQANTVRILVSTDTLPPLRFVRALTEQTADVDPTMAHCRRLVEARGGALVLAHERQRMGFAVELPRELHSPAHHGYAGPLAAAPLAVAA